MTKKCECPIKGSVPIERENEYSEEEKIGMNHEAGECKCTNDLKQYKRKGKNLWLCSCCNLQGDVLI